jgi:hypothetical protein
MVVVAAIAMVVPTAVVVARAIVAIEVTAMPL